MPTMISGTVVEPTSDVVISTMISLTKPTFPFGPLIWCVTLVAPNVLSRKEYVSMALLLYAIVLCSFPLRRAVPHDHSGVCRVRVNKAEAAEVVPSDAARAAEVAR